MQRIFGIGASGLIGSRVAEILQNSYPIDSVSKRSGVDITNPDTLHSISQDTDHRYIIHFAAKADVDGCEKDKLFGRDGEAWKINVDGVKNVISACKNTNKTFIYISTDFVFSGDDTPEGGYSEEDMPRPLNWYAQTKLEGEYAVQESGVPFIILRIAYPYRKFFSEKKDFFHTIKARLVEGLPMKGVTDHIMTPTFIDDIAFSIKKLIEMKETGIYHIVGSEFITPYDATMTIAEEFNLSPENIEKTTREAFFQGRAPRPFNLSLKNDKIRRLGVKMKGFREGITEIKKQMNDSQ